MYGFTTTKTSNDT